MPIRLLARRPLSAIQSLSASSITCRCATTPAFFVRRKHTVPSLNRHLEIRADGIPGLFSPKGFQIAYTDYMAYITSELNTATAGLPVENTDTKSIVIELARSPIQAHAFNVASMAFNNHFFFNGLNVFPNTLSTPPTELLALINNAFSSLDTLRETFLTTAEAMFGPGFVWLVQTKEPEKPLRILPTYIAGSPLSHAHYRRQSIDLNTENPDSYQAKNLNPVGAFGSAARQVERKPKKALGGVDIVPLLCVNTWEHVWLHDYGITGKRKYLEKWWDTIDWDKVKDYANITPSATNNFK